MNIDRIRTNIVGDYGLSSSNQYHIGFEFSNIGPGSLVEYMSNRGLQVTSTSGPAIFGRNDNVVDNSTKLSFLADEVNIPGYSMATGDFKGPVPGINIRYAHTRNFTELNVAFIMDMDHTPLRFLRLWSDYIVGFERSGSIEPTTYSQVEYYDNYTQDIIIDKLEPNKPKDFAKSSYDTHSVVTRTRLHKAFPYLINDVTVSNAPNQPLRLQCTFYYEYFTTETFSADRLLRDPTLGANDQIRSIADGLA